MGGCVPLCRPLLGALLLLGGGGGKWAGRTNTHRGTAVIIGVAATTGNDNSSSGSWDGTLSDGTLISSSPPSPPAPTDTTPPARVAGVKVATLRVQLRGAVDGELFKLRLLGLLPPSAGFTFDSFEQVGAARASHTLSSILNGAGQLGGHSSPTTVVPYRIGSASTAAAARFAQAVAAAAGAALDSVAVVSVMSLRRRRLWGRRRQLSGAAGETVLYSVTTTADTAVSTGVASRMSDAQAFGAALGTHMSSLSGTFNATTFDVSAPEFATKFSCTLFAPLNGSSGVIDNIALQTALDNISADSWRSVKVKGTHDVYGVSATFAMNSAGMSYYQETPDESVPFLAITIFASLGCVACVLYTRHKEFCERISLWCTQPKLSLPSPPPSPAGKDQRDLSAWSNLSVSPSPRLRDGGSATAAGDPSFDALGDLATHLQAHESTPRLDLHPSFEEATDQHNGSSAGASVTLEAGPQHTTQITGTSALAAAGHSENAAVGRVLQSLQRRRDVTQALQQQLSRVRSNLDIMMTSTSQIASQPSTPPTTRP